MSDYPLDFHQDVKMLAEVVMDLDKDAEQYKAGFSSGPGIEPDLIALAMLQEARRNLAIIEADLTNVLAKRMPHMLVVENVGTFEKHKKTNRTQWDKDTLLSAVLDSRLFNRTTGELVDETPLAKVQHVWNLSTPRTTALKDRGIDADEFAHVEDAGYTIRLIN